MRGHAALGILPALLLSAALAAGCGGVRTPSPAPSSGAVGTPANLLMGRTGLGKRPAPNFTLNNQFGQPVSLSDFRGKVVLLAFTDSQCTTMCPLTTASMVRAIHLLGPAGKDVVMLNVNANPVAISVRDVFDYSQAHGILHMGQFVTGTLPQLKAVWHAYGIAVQIIHGNIDHTPALYLIDQQGRERYLYLTNGLYGVVGEESRILAYDMAHILPPGTAKAPALPGSTANPLGSPRDKFTLPALARGARPVALGPGKPRVAIFFATWLPDAAAELGRLEAYAAWAGPHAAPQLVTVDELQTEPSLQTVRQRLSAVHVSFPALLDRTGVVADAYRAQDMPWIVIVSASGKILSSHDGWVPVSDLERQVRKDFSAVK